MAALPELTATIALTRYNEPNWLVEETVNSLAGQRTDVIMICGEG